MLIAVLVVSTFGIAIPAKANSTEYFSLVGKLNSDNYILYPFDESKNLTVGFSKYGEPINPLDVIGDSIGVGLRYGPFNDGSYIDPWCNPDIEEKSWVEGWLINITYTYQGWYRNIWAYALYSDLQSPDVSGWQRASHPTDPEVAGGRQYGASEPYIGYVVTKDPVVLYDGPRKKIVLLETDIMEDENTPLVNIYFTLIFNKVKKYIIVMKDIKRVQFDKPYGPFQIEFSQRGQWDLGTDEDGWTIYSNFYNNNETKYYKHPWYYPYESNEVGGGKTTPDRYTFSDVVTYDVCQMINPNIGDQGVVAFAAFWPYPITKYVSKFIDLGGREFRSLETHEDIFEVTEGMDQPPSFDLTYNAIPYPRGEIEATKDGIVEWENLPWVFVWSEADQQWVWQEYGTVWTWDGEDTISFTSDLPVGTLIKVVYKSHEDGAYPKTDADGTAKSEVPFIIAEWDFDMPNDPAWGQFRCVGVYGITDLHDGDDNEWRSDDIIDSEVKYMLDEVFNPWDLQDAVEKKTERWVYKVEVDEPDGIRSITLPGRTPHHILVDAEWDSYTDLPAERVLVKLPTWTDFKLVPRSGYENDDPNDATFSYTFNPDTGVIDFSPTTLPQGTLIKVLYSTVRDVEKIDEFNFELNDDRGEYIHVLHYPNVETSSVMPKIKFVMALTADDTESWVDVTSMVYTDWLEFGANDGYVAKRIPILVWNGEGDPNYYYSKFKVVYDCELGRYEWNVVGRESRATDSAGAAMVNEAFEEWKNIQVLDSALEMQDLDWGPYIPNVLAKMFGGVTPRTWWPGDRADYYDPDYRLYLKDDWCCSYVDHSDYPTGCPTGTPISSSNIISVAGPHANALTEYFQDFTDALRLDQGFGWTTYTTYYGYGCWSHRAVLTSGNERQSGYATIATYKDLNGTIGFVVQGWDGQDTYYACWALRHGLIEYLNFIQPGVTALVLHICYESHPPSISVVECLGTITECSGFDHVDGGVTVIKDIIETIASENCISDKLVSFDWPELHMDP